MIHGKMSTLLVIRVTLSTIVIGAILALFPASEAWTQTSPNGLVLKSAIARFKGRCAICTRISASRRQLSASALDAGLCQYWRMKTHLHRNRRDGGAGPSPLQQPIDLFDLRLEFSSRLLLSLDHSPEYGQLRLWVLNS